MPGIGLTENHERSLKASIGYAARLVRDCQDILAAADEADPFSRYAGALPPPQAKVAHDYLRRLRRQLLRAMDALGLPPPQPSVDSVRALTTTLIFLEDAFEEMRGRYLRGYGALSAETERALDGVVSDLQALVREIHAFLTGGSEDAVKARIAQLPDTHPLTPELRELARIIAEHGLVDLRAALVLIADRVTDDTLEVAMVGRVSSGKSSLLNALVGAPILPTGVLPVTAFPTRVRQGRAAAVHVTYASGQGETHPIDALDQFVTEAHNPGNQKKLARLLVEYPSDQLPEGVTFVDTPGLGSVATTGALQTFAYLPRCDNATYLLEASAPLSEDDLALLAFLRDAEIATTVLLSKADLLNPADLSRVRNYVDVQLRERLGVSMPVRTVSALPDHGLLLRGWIGHDVRPLDADARQRHLATLRRRIDVLRLQALRALERQRSPAGTPHAPEKSADVLAGVRDVSARLERARRDSFALSERRAAVVETALNGAAVKMAERDTLVSTPDAIRAALMRPSQDVAETASAVLQDLAHAVQQALHEAADATGTPAPTLDRLALDRETPLLDVPPLPPVPEPPVWARVSRRLRDDWIRKWVHAHWTELVDRAVAAHLDVLTHWFRKAVAELGREFESHSRALVEQLAPVDRRAAAPPLSPGAAMRDIEWLRAAGAPDSGSDVEEATRPLQRRQA
jgi:GTP-binding protein EngB required for normal cell division